MKRRNFVKTAGGILALGPASSLAASIGPSIGNVHVKPDGASQPSTIRVKDDHIVIESSTLSAVIRNGFLVTLKSKATGENYIGSFDDTRYSALDIIYPGPESVEFSEKNFRSITLKQVSDQRAEIIFHSWHGDGVVAVYADDSTGDLIVEPSAYSSRPGVLACRWNMPGIRTDLKIVAPFFQGVSLNLDDPLIRDFRWPWPMYWEAALVILQSSKGGFYVHTQDTRYRYKA
ncbi:MAG TPA: hypothetical protein VI583_08380, partial [Cyclobacteriaceae bacterium]|nr:hypothetical protein [Cyclobacteriaceae bacterium]